MATILQMLQNRLPDEAALFAASLGTVIEEAQALAGYEETAEADLTVMQKSLIADMSAKALILPAMSSYKKELIEAEGDGAGLVKFDDKLKFLQEMDKRLAVSINEKQARIGAAVDTGVPMVVVTDD